MDDRLEKFIKSHRAEMDDISPGKDLWADIESQLKPEAKQRKLINPMVFWRAAAVILLLLSSWLVFDKVRQSPSTSDVAIVNPQLTEVEDYYVSLISQKKEEFLVLSEKYELGNDFIVEIDKLDAMYSELKKDMINGNQENYIDAMILNLQLRIDLLNQQLSILKSIENSQKDEAVVL